MYAKKPTLDLWENHRPGNPDCECRSKTFQYFLGFFIKFLDQCPRCMEITSLNRRKVELKF